MKIAISYFYKMAALRFESLSWQLSNKGYLKCTFTCSCGSRTIQKHVLVHYISTGEFSENVDHIDGDTLNNEPNNLRSSTKSQNSCNRKPPQQTNLELRMFVGLLQKMWLSMRIKSGQKYTATSQESNDRVTPLFKRLESVWYTVAIRLCCADCEVSKGVRTVWVPPHPEV